MKKLFPLLFLTFNLSFFSYCTAQNSYVDSLKIILGKTTKPLERFNLLNKIEFDHWYSGNGTIDSSSVKQLLGIAQQLNNDSLRAISYDWIGEYYLYTAVDYQSALEFFLKGISLVEKGNDKFWSTILYIDVSGVYSDMNNSAEELNYLKKAEASLPDKSNPRYDYALRQTDVYWSQYFVEQNKPDSAIHYLHIVDEINNKSKSPYWESMEMNLFGIAYGQKRDLSLAEVYLKKALNQANLNKDYYGFCSIAPSYVDLLLFENRVEESKRQAMQGFTICTEHKFYIQSITIANLLRAIYFDLKNMDSAYYFSQIESAMKDSMFSQQKLNRLQATAFSEQIRVKEEEAKSEEEKERRRENIQYVLIAGSILSFVILFLLLSRRIITNEKLIEFLGVIALLIVFEFLNLVLHPFLDKLTHHTPLFMLLALVCIAGILVPLHHRIEKWATHRLVEKNKQIRLAAAKKTIEKLENNK